MATTTQVWCDRCRCQITTDRTELEILCGPLRYRRDAESLDLCLPCSEALVTWLSAPALAHPPAQAPATPAAA